MKLRRFAILACVVGIAAALAPSTASADVGDRVRVCADELELNREPNEGWDGVLREGESFAVRKHSDPGKYAYGFAYGDINRVGWVETAGLCGTARAAAAQRLVGDRARVCADLVEVKREPNQGWDGVLSEGESFAVRKLSDSGKYAYGLAYGTIKRVGWVETEALCAASSARAAVAADLVDKRVPVVGDQLLVYEEPNASYVGSLQRGETFRVSKLSDSGKYAYGVAYGDVDKVGWVLTAGLAEGNLE